MKNKLKNINIYFVIIISCLLFFGIYLRTKALINSPDFWFDETALLQNIIDRPIIEFFSKLSQNQCCPPFFMFIGKIIYSIFGLNEKALKCISYFFSISSLFAFFYLCLKIFKNKLTIIFALFLFSFNYQLVFFSGIFKQYSSDCFTTILILLFIINYDKIRHKMKNIHYFALGIAGGICILFSYTSLFLITNFFLLFLIKKFIINKEKIEYKKLLFFLLPFLIISVSLIITTLLPAKNNDHLQLHWSCIESFYPANMKEIKKYIIYHLISADTNFLLILIILLLSSILFFKNNKKNFFILITPFLFGFILGKLKIYPFHALNNARMILWLFPLFYIYFCYPLEYLKFKKRNIIFSIILIIIYFFAINYKVYITHRKEEPYWSTGKEYLYETAKEDLLNNDIIFATDEQYYTYYVFQFKYHLIKNFKAEEKNFTNKYQDINNAKKGTIIYFYIRKDDHNSSYYIYNTNKQKKWIEEHCKIIKTKEGKHGILTRCQKI